MRLVPVLVLALASLSGCAGKFEQLAKCSAEENPIPSLAYETGQKPTAPEQALADIVNNDCGPMRPVNSFQGG
ncbi:hypothetical protein J5277_18180 [Rhizobium sp. 16-449-1b]|uniref:hypothetical protein n=1 Tax=Rhizobium sp. 16-449-1b TaxID=2819989 RepID=UPI001ADC7E42|nr:hypothetical protein [Rhizobium sp. 16-449-1b]